jgi:two-component system chemotaxis sensor kinase CheA
MSVLEIRQMSKAVTETFAAQGAFLVERGAALIDGDSFEALVNSQDSSDPFYEEARLKLLELRKFSNCKYLYTMAPLDGSIWQYVIDGSAEPDDIENFSNIGDEEDTSDYDDAFRRVWTSGRPEGGDLVYQGEWGWLVSSYIPIKNSAGNTVGIIGCDYDGENLHNTIIANGRRQIIIGVISVLLGLMLVLFLVGGITNPIVRIAGVLKIVAEGDLTQSININTKDEIGDLARGFNFMMGNIRNLVNEITLMKDSLKTGIFFMDRNYIIQSHYSGYLEELLSETDLAGQCFPDLLSSSFNARELDDIRNYFEMIFKQTFDQNMLEDINPLGEFQYINAKTDEKKVFNCSFSVIEQGREEVFILAVIYDITAKVELQQRLAEEESRRQEEMKNVFELVQLEPPVLDDFNEDAEYEFERIYEALKNDTASAQEALIEIYQSVHAIKSNAVILGLNIFGDKVHKLESEIKKLREQDEVDFDDMLDLILKLERLYWEKDEFKTTIKKINSFKSSGGGRRHGQYVLVESLAKTINRACEDMGKKIKLLVDGIDDEAIEKGPRRIIKEALVQLVRNSTVHGIELPTDRIAQGKDETGIIRLSIKVNDKNIHVKLRDDGRGLDFGKIAEKALRLNLIKPEEADNKNVLLKVIFSPGFSTAETEGIHAGRGIGLNLVQYRVRSGKGSIKVHTVPGKGTEFNIFFPVSA